MMAFFNSQTPPVAVYLVKFALIAAMPACLMLSGVGKSGSPAPKSPTSMPSRRRRSASAATFIVEDSLISDIRSANSSVACMDALFYQQTLFQPLFDKRRNEAGNVAAQTDYLFHQARA